MGYIIYIYSRDRGRRIERGKKGWGKKETERKKKNGDTYKSEAGRRAGGRTGVRGRDANTKTKEETKLR